jgi:hypothetical protein
VWVGIQVEGETVKPCYCGRRSIVSRPTLLLPRGDVKLPRSYIAFVERPIFLKIKGKGQPSQPSTAPCPDFDCAKKEDGHEHALRNGTRGLHSCTCKLFIAVVEFRPIYAAKPRHFDD